MLDSDDDDVPISKLVPRLKERQEQRSLSGSDGQTEPSPPPTEDVEPEKDAAAENDEKQQALVEPSTDTTKETTSVVPAVTETTEKSEAPMSHVTDPSDDTMPLPSEAEKGEPEQEDATPAEEPRTTEINPQDSKENPRVTEDDKLDSNLPPATKAEKPSTGADVVEPEKMDVDDNAEDVPPTESEEKTEADTHEASPVTNQDAMEAEPENDKVAVVEKSTKNNGNPENNTPEHSVPERPKDEVDFEGLRDAFPDIVVPRKRKKGVGTRKGRRKLQKIQIRVERGSSEGSETSSLAANGRYGDTVRYFEEKLYGSVFGDAAGSDADDRDVLREFEDSLAFYSETHEEQDPAFLKFCKEREKQRLEDEVARLDEDEKQGKAEIERIVDSQLKEKQASADRNIEKLRSKSAVEENRDLQKLLQLYNEKTKVNQTKIDQALKLINRRKHQEMQKALMQHRQQVQQRGVPEQVANAEWSNASQHLQAKYQRQIQEFTAKGESVKKRCEADYKREQEKLRNHHNKKKQEMERGMNKVLARMHSNFQQQRQRHLLRHEEKMKRKKEIVVEKLRTSKLETVKEEGCEQATLKDDSAKKNKAEISPPAPIKSSMVPSAERDGDKSRAAARYKHRKSLLSVIPKQLSVEIHNEGLWMSSLVEKNSRSEKKEGGKSPTSKESERKDADTDYEFIQWGTKARAILHAIICGEIPIGYGSERFDFGDSIANQGGHIRCVVTDMRTSELTASAERAAAMKEEQEASIADLEKKSAKLGELVLEAEKNHARADAEEKECLAAVEKASKEKEKGKQMLHDFRTKFKNYFGPDGTPVVTANPSDRQKLMQAMVRYQTQADSAEAREKTVRASLTEAKSHAQKMHNVVRQTQKASIAASAMLKRKKAMLQSGKVGRGGRSKLSDAAELERASNRVKDVINVFRRTADRRREQLNQKRSSSASSTWVQALPGVSGPLKKSLWHKMHRRRLQVVLRPTMASTILGLKQSMKPSGTNRQDGSSAFDSDQALRAEQLLLLSTFPAAPALPLPSTPPSRSAEKWAEPGWHLRLDVPTDDRQRSSLLPCRPSFPILEKNLAEFCSAPGRQVAALIKVPFLRTLTAPLSAAAQATSLAETNPSLLSTSGFAENDPLATSEQALLAGYKFPTKTTTRSSSQPRKRTSSSAAKEESETSTTSKRKGSVEAAASRSSGTSGTSERRSSKSTKRSRSKASTDSQSQTNTKTSKTEAGPAVPHQALEPYMQHQTASASLSMRGVYSQQQTQPSMDQQAAQYSQYMKQRDALQLQQQQTVQSPSQQQQHVALQQIQTQQQQLMPPQAQQYASPQQQFHQQQHMAQMRMMQQQQQQGRQAQVAPPYAQQQGPQAMQAFFPPMSQQSGRQKSYGSQQQMQVGMNRGVGQAVMGGPSRSSTSSPRRTSQQQQEDSQHDPLLFLK